MAVLEKLDALFVVLAQCVPVALSTALIPVRMKLPSPATMTYPLLNAVLTPVSVKAPVDATIVRAWADGAIDDITQACRGEPAKVTLSVPLPAGVFAILLLTVAIPEAVP